MSSRGWRQQVDEATLPEGPTPPDPPPTQDQSVARLEQASNAYKTFSVSDLTKPRAATDGVCSIAYLVLLAAAAVGAVLPLRPPAVRGCRRVQRLRHQR